MSSATDPLLDDDKDTDSVIDDGLAVQDLTKLDIASLTPLTYEVHALE